MTTETLLTSEAKEALRKAVRGLREPLIEMLTDAAKSAYRLDLPIEKAKLPAGRHRRRERLEACLDEQARSAAQVESRAASSGKAKKGQSAKSSKKKSADSTAAPDSESRGRFFRQAVKEAAHTLVNRLVMLRILEHHGLVAPAVVTGGMSSPAYEQELVHYAGPLGEDDTRGYRYLLETVFAELALELPGLFGSVGLTRFFPVPASAIRAVVEALNDPALASAWGDDTTLGWVYQYWNDPDREALDKKIADGGKIEPHEIASKTQMFTERYMVEWLLQNSLGLTWLCISKKNGWTADAEGLLPELDTRRAEWRKKREAGEVALDALMPIADGLESDWKYYVPQPIPDDAVEKAPSSIRELKLLDPACGSGHFLVIAFGLLARMYEEEARHRGETWSAEEIAASIVANNLHGVDIDSRAIQIAAAALWLKAKLHAPGAKLARMNLIAPTFRLAALPKDDPALARLYRELGALGIAEATASKLVESLAGVDYLGTLLRIDRAILAATDDTSKEVGPLFADAVEKQRGRLEERVAALLDAHASESDLGLRLEGEQLAAGLRFIEIVKEGRYDVVVGNPPYQGLSKTAKFDYVVKNYPRGKADLYAAFLERGLELVRDGGMSALLTMRGWMFLGQFKELRAHILATFDLRCIGDFDRGAFDEVPNEVLAVSAPIVRRATAPNVPSVGMQPTPFDDKSYDRQRTNRKRAAVLAQVGRHEFDPKRFAVIDGEPIVYWWSKQFLERYGATPKLGQRHTVRYGLSTQNNSRWLRRPWEIRQADLMLKTFSDPKGWDGRPWVTYIKGSEGRLWCDEVSDCLLWRSKGLELATYPENRYGRGTTWYYERGVAFANIGANFSARAHSRPSIFGHVAGSVFTEDVAQIVCLLNSTQAKHIMQSLNPGLHFLTTDVERLPLLTIQDAETIFGRIESAFAEHEAQREPSVEYVSPGRSPWRYAQVWGQRAVDRPEDEPLPPYDPDYDPPDPTAFVSFAAGVALGRFGENGEGILDTAPADALPAGILFVGPDDTLPDSLAHPAAQRIAAAWDKHRTAVAGGKPLPVREWLRKDFFAYHKALYENRPIYFPLSSEKRSFVAWVSIHRWTDTTLKTLVADHLNPVLRQLDGEIADLNTARASSDKKVAVAAEKNYGTLKRLRDELADFTEMTLQCAERGAPPADPADPRTGRAADAPFHMDLDDGVMINSAALWPLLAPQWSDPKKWWKQLCLAEGKKDYDWAHLARRYFPTRVDAKCQDDPSLAVAHGCFWKYHPAKAYAWELRLQDEIRPDFTIDEEGSDEARATFLRDHPDEAAAIHAKEMQRRERKASKAADDEPEDDAAPPSDEADAGSSREDD